MHFEGECLCSVCWPSSLLSTHFTFLLIFSKVSKEKVHFFIWNFFKKFNFSNNLFMIERSWGHIKWYLPYPHLVSSRTETLSKTATSRKCMKQSFPNYSRAQSGLWGRKGALRRLSIFFQFCLDLPCWDLQSEGSSDGFSCLNIFVN